MTSTKKNILLIDDEKTLVKTAMSFLISKGYDVEGAATGKEGIERLKEKVFDLIFCDLNLPDITGMEVLSQTKSLSPETVFIIITAFGSIEMAVKAVKEGAYDFISKPFSFHELLIILDKALERTRLLRENRAMRQEIKGKYAFSNLIGNNKNFRHLLDLIERVAETNCQVLITGETGTGKELVAKAIHHNSERADRIYFAINASAIPRELLESELFGHERGAFTGAFKTRKGLFEEADGSTLFLDEIGDLTVELQAKLLRAIEEGEIKRVGGNKVFPVDVRIITATNKDLTAEVAAGRFRKDLYYRLNVVQIHIPPLRERRDDIPLLAQRFLEKYSKEYNRPLIRLSPGANEILKEQPWEGNVRELENLMERFVVMHKDKEVIEEEDIASIASGKSRFFHNAVDAKLSIEEYSVAFVKKYQEEYTEAAIAHLLGISPKTLWEKRKKWKLPRSAESRQRRKQR